MAKRRKRGPRANRALTIVRQAKSALDSLRQQIRNITNKLQTLQADEKSIIAALFGSSTPGRGRRGPGRPPGTGRRGRKAAARPRRKGPPLAERYFAKLRSAFSLEDVRKLAGRRAGISLAQWSRAKRIRKVANGYQKVG